MKPDCLVSEPIPKGSHATTKSHEREHTLANNVVVMLIVIMLALVFDRIDTDQRMHANAKENDA